MINKFKSISLLIILCLLSSIVYAELPATEQYQFSKTPTEPPLWSEKQQESAQYEKIMLKAIKDNPQNKNNYANLANLYLANNKTIEAINSYQDAINHDPENPKLFAALSIAYLHQSKYSMAKAMAEQAIKLDPEMKQAMKIKEYILAKGDLLSQASMKPAMQIDLNHK